MQNGGRLPQKRPVARVAAWGSPPATARFRGWRTPTPPALASFLQHLAIALPICGALSVVYGFYLSQNSPAAPLAATGQTVLHAPVWQGHLHTFYITPLQQLAWWVLGGAGLAWLVGMVCTLTLLGVRRHLSEKRSNRS